jgi:hypothetical protein
MADLRTCWRGWINYDISPRMMNQELPGQERQRFLSWTRWTPPPWLKFTVRILAAHKAALILVAGLVFLLAEMAARLASSFARPVPDLKAHYGAWVALLAKTRGLRPPLASSQRRQTRLSTIARALSFRPNCLFLIRRVMAWDAGFPALVSGGG